MHFVYFILSGIYFIFSFLISRDFIRKQRFQNQEKFQEIKDFVRFLRISKSQEIGDFVRFLKKLKNKI